MKAFVLVTCATDKIAEVMEDITTVINVNSIRQVMGAYDIIVELENTEKIFLAGSVVKIRKILGVRSTMVLYDKEAGYV